MTSPVPFPFAGQIAPKIARPRTLGIPNVSQSAVSLAINRSTQGVGAPDGPVLERLQAAGGRSRYLRLMKFVWPIGCELEPGRRGSGCLGAHLPALARPLRGGGSRRSLDRLSGRSRAARRSVDEVVRHPLLGLHGQALHEKRRSRLQARYNWLRLSLQAHGAGARRPGVGRTGASGRAALPGMMLHRRLEPRVGRSMVGPDRHHGDATSDIYSAFFVAEEGTMRASRGCPRRSGPRACSARSTPTAPATTGTRPRPAARWTRTPRPRSAAPWRSSASS